MHPEIANLIARMRAEADACSVKGTQAALRTGRGLSLAASTVEVFLEAEAAGETAATEAGSCSRCHGTGSYEDADGGWDYCDCPRGERAAWAVSPEFQEDR